MDLTPDEFNAIRVAVQSILQFNDLMTLSDTRKMIIAEVLNRTRVSNPEFRRAIGKEVSRFIRLHGLITNENADIIQEQYEDSKILFTKIKDECTALKKQMAEVKAYADCANDKINMLAELLDEKDKAVNASSAFEKLDKVYDLIKEYRFLNPTPLQP